MKKSAKIFIIVGAALVLGGIIFIAVTLLSVRNGENALVYERTVQARITDMYVKESTTGQHKKQGGTGYTGGHTTNTYYVKFLISDGGEPYTDEQSVSKSLYNEYAALEKNKDMEFKIYVNPDGNRFLSQRDLGGANNEYWDSGSITLAMAGKIIGGMLAALIGLMVIKVGTDMPKETEGE